LKREAILFFFSYLEVNSTWLITSELANQCARKALFTCVVYTSCYYYYCYCYYYYLLLLLSSNSQHCPRVSHHWMFKIEIGLHHYHKKQESCMYFTILLLPRLILLHKVMKCKSITVDDQSMHHAIVLCINWKFIWWPFL